MWIIFEGYLGVDYRLIIGWEKVVEIIIRHLIWQPSHIYGILLRFGCALTITDRLATLQKSIQINSNPSRSQSRWWLGTRSHWTPWGTGLFRHQNKSVGGLPLPESLLGTLQMCSCLETKLCQAQKLMWFGEQHLHARSPHAKRNVDCSSLLDISVEVAISLNS